MNFQFFCEQSPSKYLQGLLCSANIRRLAIVMEMGEALQNFTSHDTKFKKENWKCK